LKLYLNALGVVNPLGWGKRQVASNLFAGSRYGLVNRSDLLPDRTVRVGSVTGALPVLPERLDHLDCRNNRLTLAALRQIEQDTRGARDRFGSDRIAVIMGTSTSGISDAESAIACRFKSNVWPRDFRFRGQELGSLARFVAEYFELAGPTYTISTACSSSAKVFASAQRLMELGVCDAAVVGGVDTLCRMTVGGFDSMQALAKDYCNPFSINRDGINIGEGAAVFLMTSQEAAVSLLGVGESSDAYHVSAPDPEGKGAELAMRRALEAARLTANDIGYINLHGTATELNDPMEARAVNAIFGAETLCSSSKALTGHMLGAAGANEAAFLWLMLEPDFASGTVPPHVWDGEADPAIARLNFASASMRVEDTQRLAVLSNSFAFGGSNASVVLGFGW